MSSWPELPLTDVARLTRGTEPGSASYTDASRGVRFLRVGDVTGKTDNPVYTDSSQVVRVDASDLLLTLDGSPGHVSSGLEGAISSGLRKVERLDPDTTSLSWLRYSLMSPSVQETIRRHTTGVTILHASAAVPHIRISVPPLREQDRIVRILDEADALRRLRRDSDTKSAALIESLYLRMFCQGENRQSWTAESISSLAEQRDGSIRTGPFGSQLLHSEFVETGVPVLGIENVVTNEFRWTPQRCIPLGKYRQFERFRVFPGDVLVTIMGTVGRCCVAPDELLLCMSTKHLCVITPDRTKVHPRFLWAALLFDPAIRQETASVGVGAIMEGWNSTIIRELTLHVPPLQLQNEFANLVAGAREIDAAQFASRQRLEGLFQALLQQAFLGEL